MKIIQLIPELQQGGVEIVVLNLNRELVKRGHQSIVISAGGSLVKTIESDGGQHITLDLCSKNPLTLPARVHALRTQLRTLRPALIHAHSRVPAWIAHFANRTENYPFVTSVHGFNSVSAYSKIMTQGDRVICVSHPIKTYIQQHYQTPDNRIDVIHPGVDATRFDPKKLDTAWIESFKKQHNLDGKMIVTTVGRITELKDYKTFIHAIAQAVKETPNLRGLIVGDARHNKQEYYQKLQQLTRELGVEKQLLFIAGQTRIAEIYALSDRIVSCSKKPESFGLTLIEALAMNTPVIATHHGGPLDIIREGENGFFFEPQQPAELAKKITDLTPPRCTNLRADTLDRFGIDRMIDATLTTYQKL